MNENQVALKGLAKISLVAMMALFILGAIFYKERVLFSDAAFYLFNIINNHSFFFPHDRYGCFITEVLPYLGQKTHLSVNALIFLYGISFYLFYLLVALILVYWLKQYRLAILITLFYFLFASQSFIWNSEIPEAVAWMFLLFGVTIHLGNKKANIFLLCVPFVLLAFITLYTHFVVMIPTAFLWIYFIVEKKNWPFSRKITALLSCLIIFLIIMKFVIVLNNKQATYDNNNLQGVTHISFKSLFDSFNTPVIQMFLRRCLINYWAAVIIFIMGTINLVKNRQIALTIWTLLSILGYFILMGVTYGSLDKNFLLIHAETEWLSIGIIAATPWVFSLLPGNNPVMASRLLIGIFIIRLGYIVITLPLFTERIKTNEEILAQMRKKGITKLALYDNERLRSINILDWGAPFESLLMSQSIGEKPQLTFIFINPDNKKLIAELPGTKGVFNSWGVMDNNSFNNLYFTIDSLHGYQVMTYEQLLK